MTVHQQYLQTLELAPGASTDELKMAYRRLSKQYHPDVNQSPEAHTAFIRISEAYHFLLKAGTTPTYQPPKPKRSPSKNYEEAWMAHARAKAKKAAWAREQMMKQHVRMMVNVYRYILAGMLLFNAVYFIDYFLPTRSSQERVQSVYLQGTKNRSWTRGQSLIGNDMVAIDHHTINLSRTDASFIGAYTGKYVTLHTTFIMRYPRHIQFKDAWTTNVMTPNLDLYNSFGALMPVMLLLGLFFWRLRDDPDMQLNIAVFTIFIFSLQIAVY